MMHFGVAVALVGILFFGAGVKELITVKKRGHRLQGETGFVYPKINLGVLCLIAGAIIIIGSFYL